jgi:hypothetical protein
MGENDWSEMTPGWDAEIACGKGHWEMGKMDGTDEYRKAIQKASTCPDWQFFKEITGDIHHDIPRRPIYPLPF